MKTGKTEIFLFMDKSTFQLNARTRQAHNKLEFFMENYIMSLGNILGMFQER